MQQRVQTSALLHGVEIRASLGRIDSAVSLVLWTVPSKVARLATLVAYSGSAVRIRTVTGPMSYLVTPRARAKRRRSSNPTVTKASPMTNLPTA